MRLSESAPRPEDWRAHFAPSLRFSSSVTNAGNMERGPFLNQVAAKDAVRLGLFVGNLGRLCGMREHV
ncbi:hypothetical protein KC347_g194 [Hortaea werneckii]|nr:hypothetical protein KC347_g194 [Hortaea werneckii]